MEESEEKHEPQKGPRCDPKQLALLKKCSEKKDITEWNNRLEENPDEEIWLEGADLSDAHLEGAHLKRALLQKAKLNEADLKGAILTEAHLEDVNLLGAHLEKAFLLGAHLEIADLFRAHLQGAHLKGALLQKAKLNEADLKGAILTEAHLEGAHLNYAHLEGAFLWEAHLEGAHLHNAHLEAAVLLETHLEGAHLDNAHLEGADLKRALVEGAHLNYAHLEGAYLDGAYLEGADFRACSVDGLTLFWNCRVDRKTDFRCVGLDSCRMDEGTKYLLEYNKRRLNWEEWYWREPLSLSMLRQLLTDSVRLFWCLSDYGRSTIRILAVFLALAIVFAVAYWGMPECVMVNGQVGGLVNFLHALYFSVVTMTTLGFGDIAANPASACGQVLLMLQVFCGYFLLGAIVTRLSILFTAGGPAGKFSKKEK